MIIAAITDLRFEPATAAFPLSKNTASFPSLSFVLDAECGGIRNELANLGSD